MSAELSIVLGFGMITAMFAYYAFELRKSTEQFAQKISILFFAFSILFLNAIMYAMVAIGDQSLSYLSNGVLSPALRILTYFTVAVGIMYFGIVFLMTAYGFYGMAKETIKVYWRGRGPEE